MLLTNKYEILQHYKFCITAITSLTITVIDLLQSLLCYE